MAFDWNRNSKILLVDDDPLQVRVREAVLRDADFRVLIATSAEAALALLRVNSSPVRADAIVTDHMLPGASGAEFVRGVRRLHPTVPIVVLTGMATAEQEYAGLNVAFLVKPVPPDELIYTIKTLLASAAAA
jgi:DNA-binding response OmpR family regulator